MRKIVLNFNDFITESVGNLTYHFTDFLGMINILKSNTFKLMPIGIRDKDNTNRAFYFSTTRSKSIDTGYAHVIFDDKNYLFRITLDGGKLNHRYKSIPFDFFHTKKKHKGLRSEKWQYEAEDRIVSNSPLIKNAISYIKQIDLVFDNVVFSKDSNVYHYLGNDVHNINYIYNIMNEGKIPFNIYYSTEDYKKGLTGSIDKIKEYMSIIPDDRDEFITKENELILEMNLNWMEILIYLNIAKSESEVKNIVESSELDRDYIQKYFKSVYDTLKRIHFDSHSITHYVISNFNDSAKFEYGIYPEYDKFRIKLFNDKKKYKHTEDFIKSFEN